MIDVSAYLGLPFEACGRGPLYDCYGLVRQVYRDHLSIELPIQTGYIDTLSSGASEMIDAEKVNWQPVAMPEPYDVVLFDFKGEPHHIGLVIAPGWMLHTTRALKQSCIEKYTRPAWRSRIEGFYRYDNHRCPPSPAA